MKPLGEGQGEGRLGYQVLNCSTQKQNHPGPGQRRVIDANYGLGA